MNRILQIVTHALARSRTISERAEAFAKANRAAIAKRRTDPSIFVSEDCPVSVFMAGSPGAGKTEASVDLLARLGGANVLRIDPDEIREEEFSSLKYQGSDASLYQRAVSILVDRILDHAFKNCQSFVLDGTLSSIGVAVKNIQRSLDRKRVVQVLFVYQEPRFAWQFVCAREAAEGRRVPADKFVDQYFASREVAAELKQRFGKDLKLDLLIKNTDGSNRTYQAGVDQIDSYIPEQYSRNEVLEMTKQA